MESQHKVTTYGQPTARTIRVGLVEDQQLVRQGIASLIAISQHIEVSWQAENGQEALKRLQTDAVDVLLSDIRMPVLDGISLLKQLRAAQNPIPVIMLTTFDDSELFLNSLQAGANGFLLKDVSLDKLLEAIETVAQGGHLIEPSVLEQMQQSSATAQSGPTHDLLSEREREILGFMAGDFPIKKLPMQCFWPKARSKTMSPPYWLNSIAVTAPKPCLRGCSSL